MARIPIVEQAWGQDELARVHRLVGFTSFNLMVAHIVLTTLGYSAGTDLGVIATFVDQVLHSPGMLLATGRHRRARHGRRHLGQEGARRSCATSPGTCCTSTPTSAPGSPCRTSSGPVRTSRRTPSPPSSGGACMPLRSRRPRLPGRPAARPLAPPPPRRLRRRRRVAQRDVGRHRRAAASTGCPSAPASSSSGASSTGAGWTRGNPYSLSAAPDGRSLRITAEARRRLERAPRDAPSRHQGPRRGALRPAARRGPHQRARPCSSVPASASRRSAPSSRSCPPRPDGDVVIYRVGTPVRHRPRRRAARPRPRQGRPVVAVVGPPQPRARQLAARRVARTSATPRRCCASSPTSPSATSTSAATLPGWTPSSPQPTRPACRRRRPPRTLQLLTPRPDARPSLHRPERATMRRIVIWAMSTLTVLVLLFSYHTLAARRPSATAETRTVHASDLAAAAPARRPTRQRTPRAGTRLGHPTDLLGTAARRARRLVRVERPTSSQRRPMPVTPSDPLRHRPGPDHRHRTARSPRPTCCRSRGATATTR